MLGGGASCAAAVSRSCCPPVVGWPRITISAARPPSITFSFAVITTYDGDFDIYIPDFVAQLGDVFDALLDLPAPGVAVVRTPAYTHSFAHHHPVVRFTDVRGGYLASGGRLTVDLGPELFARWREGGGRATGVKQVGQYAFEISDFRQARFYGVLLSPRTRPELKLRLAGQYDLQ